MLFLASEHPLDKDSFCYTELQSAKGEILVVTLGEVTPEDPGSTGLWRGTRAQRPGKSLRWMWSRWKRCHMTPSAAIPPEPPGLNLACVKSLGNTLREMGVAPNSFSWTLKDEGPFPGLRPLVEGMKPFSVAGDLEIRDGIKALDELRGTITGRVLLIQAPSGAGKSSFLRAGLWRRLRRHPGFTPLAIVRTQGGAVRHRTGDR